jgi:GNAT superfamily N-acetyltransferase
MSKINITLAKEADAHKLKTIAMDAFEGNFERYGHYPPGIESVEWHLAQIKSGDYYKIKYGDVLVGGIDLIPKNEEHYKIEYFFISSDYQNKKIGSIVMKFIEEQYKHISKWSLATPYKEYRNHYFYEKLGYVKVGEYNPVQNNDFKLFEYEKKL